MKILAKIMAIAFTLTTYAFAFAMIDLSTYFNDEDMIIKAFSCLFVAGMAAILGTWFTIWVHDRY